MLKSMINPDASGKNTSLILGFMLIMLLAMSTGLMAYSGGDGSESTPYQIASTADLIELSNTSGDWGDYFEQTADISFNADETQVDWDGVGGADGEGTSGFSPIGNNTTTQFTGSYNGGVYTIDNLYINRSTTDYIGLFGYTSGSSITNIGVTNVNITGSARVGGLVGINVNTTVSNSYSTGSVTGTDDLVGGLVGYNYFSGSKVSNSYSTGDVTRSAGAGPSVGGFCGKNYDSTIEYCYSTGSVSYTSATDPMNKGFVGLDDGGTYNDNFWDSEASNQSDDSPENPVNYTATGKTTNEMKGITAGNTISDWGWSTDVWERIGNNYPRLIDNPDQSLPVELTSFTAENQSGGVLLKWTTESEIENLGFILSRKLKVQSLKWAEIASYLTNDALAGHGSTTRRHDYGYTDTQVQSGVTYEYRLGDVDYSGTVTWHAAVEITIPDADAAIPAAFGLQKAYPNPFNPAVTLRYGLTRDAKTTLQVYNMRGQLVETLVSMFKTAGSYDFVWQPQNLSTGVYIVCLKSGNQTNLRKVVFVK